MLQVNSNSVLHKFSVRLGKITSARVHVQVWRHEGSNKYKLIRTRELRDMYEGVNVVSTQYLCYWKYNFSVK